MSRFALLVCLSSSVAFGQFIPNRYTVILQDPPVSARFTSRETLQSGPAVAYRRQVEARQAEVARAMESHNVRVTGTESTLLNAIFVSTTPDHLSEVMAIPGVLGVRPMRKFKPVMNKAVQLMNAPAAWNLLGGQANAGKGIKIAILDSGIDQTHPAFQDSTLTPPSGFPKCTTGHPEDCSYTNNKVIVARSYTRPLSQAFVTDPKNPAAQSMPDDYSPRDRFGHGTAVASVAAANTNTGAVTFTGMAPKAFLGNYKITGSPAVNDGTDDQILIQAMSDAVADGMDIASLSYGGIALTAALDTGAACGVSSGTPCDPVATAYEAAAKGGMVIVVAAGNGGNDAYFNGGQYPYFDSISSPSTAPSVISVGASTNSHVMTPSVSVSGAPSALQNINAETSDADFEPSQIGANSAPIVDVTKVGNDGLACTALPQFSLYNSYALIQRGTCPFATKASNAALAGAIGVILYMADSSALISPSGITFTGPVVMISNSDGVALKNYIGANPGAVVTIDAAGIDTDLNTYSQANGLSPAGPNQLASYSSQGPTPDGQIKPDLIAVGGFDAQISFPISSGLYMATQSYDQTLDGSGETLWSANRYIAADGTSFSTPMVAGAAALVKQLHPAYTAAQIKSALVNSTSQTVTVDDFGDPVDTQWLGAGMLDAGAAAAATVTAEPSTVSFGFLKAGATLPINKTFTISNFSTASVTLAVSTAANTTVAGTTVAVDKSSITLAPGANTTLTVSLSGAVPKAGEYSGAVTLKATGVSLRLPYMFIVGDGVAFNANPILPFAFGTPGTDGGTLAVHVTDQFGAPVVGSPVTFTVSPRGSITFQSVSGEPACTPNNSVNTTSCNTDNYGIAYVEVILGSNLSSPSITAKAAGTTFQLGAFILAAPQVAASGVLNAGDFSSNIAPGSYIAIKGSNLVDSGALTNANGDSETSLILPLSLDYTTVSFDVPSAGISVPGYMTFASPGQVNLQIPWELQGQSSVQVKVTSDEGLFGNVVTVPLVQFAPAFFEGNGIVAAINATQGNLVTASTPVHAGDVVELFGNGLGPVNNQPASGNPAPSNPLATTKSQPTVTIGGQSAPVSFSGLAPGFPGLYQINVTVPSGVAAGTPAITVAIGGVTSKASTIPLK